MTPHKSQRTKLLFHRYARTHRGVCEEYTYCMAITVELLAGASYKEARSKIRRKFLTISASKQ